MKKRILLMIMSSVALLVLAGSFHVVQGERQYPTLDVSPVWSPDGSHIAFVRRHSDSKDIWIMDADGSNKFNLTNGKNFNSFDWSPDGSKTVFASQRAGTQMSSLLITDITNGKEINLTDQLSLSANLNLLPQWSPDGKYIAFSSSTTSRADIMVANLEDLTYQNVTLSLGDMNMLFSWSPDSQHLAVSSEIWDEEGSLNVWVIALDGSEKVNLTESLPDTDQDNPLLVIKNLVWSPSTDLIAFTPSYARGPDNIYLANQSGTSVHNLTQKIGGINPAWSPDSSKIAFVSDYAGNRDVWVIDIDGSNLRNLTATNQGDDGGGSWSPDGSKLAFVSDRGGPFNVWIMNMDDLSVVNLTDDE